jgi:hypothetical protein
MGVVYEATQLSLDRTVALKILSSQLGDDDDFRERFRREGRIQAAIDHPHIVTVHEAGEIDAGLFLAMHLIRGRTLKDLIVARELDGRRTLQLLGPIADALDAAHEADLIHRDVKPHNILVGDRDHPYLADFGLTKGRDDSRLTRTGQFVGTLDYISPEQIRGEPAQPASDVYALTAVLYECLTGTVPYPKDSDAAVIFAHMTGPPPRVTERREELPVALDDVIARGMAQHPDDRPATSSQLIAATAAVLNETAAADVRPPPPATRAKDVGMRESEAKVPTRESRVRRDRTAEGPRWWQRLSRGWLIAAAAMALLVAVAGVLLGRSGAEAPTPPALIGSASNGDIALAFPSGWQHADRAPSIPGLDLASPLALAAGPSEIVAGQTQASGATLLPKKFLARLPDVPSTKDRVHLGSLQAIRYRNLKPRGLSGGVTLFVVPTSIGVTTVACRPAVHPPAALARDCERIAGSLRLRRGRAFALGPDAAYARRLSAAITRLQAKRSSGRRRLARASTQGGQEAAARSLGDAYRATAARLRQLVVSPLNRDANARLIAAVTSAKSAYGQLAGAAGNDNRSGYNRAAGKARVAERHVNASLRDLRALGYR